MKDKISLQELYEPLKNVPADIGDYINAAKDWFTEYTKYFAGTANFAGFYRNLKTTNISTYQVIGAPCHGRISGFPFSDNTGSLYFEIIATECGWERARAPNGTKNTFTTFAPFARWLVNSSYMAPMFLVKDLDFIEKFGFVLSTRVNTPLLQNALITTRHFFECFKNSFEIWNTLVDEGVDPHFAYFICFNSTISVVNDFNRLSNTTFYNLSGHRALPVFTFNEMHNFYTESCFLKESFRETFYDGNRKYVGGFALFSDNITRTMVSSNNYSNFIYEMYENYDKSFPEFRKLVKQYRTTQTEITGVVNPFTPVRTPRVIKAEGSVYCDEVLNVVIPYLREKGLNFNGKEIFNLGRKEDSRLRKDEDVRASRSIQRQHRGNDAEGKLQNRIGSRRR